MTTIEKALRDLEVCANTVDGCYTRNPGNFAAALRDLRDSAERARTALAALESAQGAEREAFEAQMRVQAPTFDEQLLLGRLTSGNYASLITQHCWLAWQARASLGVGEARPAQDAAEPTSAMLNAAIAANMEFGVEINVLKEAAKYKRAWAAMLASTPSPDAAPDPVQASSGTATALDWEAGTRDAASKPVPGTMGWDWIMWFAAELHATPKASLAEVLDRLGYVPRDQQAPSASGEQDQ